MSNRIILLAIALLTVKQTYSQINLGFKTGVNYVNIAESSNINGFTARDTKYRVGFHFGLYSTLELNEKVLK